MRRWLLPCATGALLAATLGGCAGEPTPRPTVGAPAPVQTTAPASPSEGSELARRWGLTGVDLPADWPDIPLPEGTEVVTAYAIGSSPRRTWTATFAADDGTALDLAEPVVAAMRKRGYVPIAEYVGDRQTNTGLYSFAAPTYAVYVVLGEDDGRPNLVITVRGTTDESAGLPSGSARPTPAAGAVGTASPVPTP